MAHEGCAWEREMRWNTASMPDILQAETRQPTNYPMQLFCILYVAFYEQRMRVAL